jgi:hypothetical protein
MALTDEEIVLGYRLFLGRQPKEDEVRRMQANVGDLSAMRKVFLGSAEFGKSFDRALGPLTANVATRLKAGDGPTPVLVHLHVPKTAGSSLTQLLQPHFHGYTAFAVNDDTLDTLNQLSPRRRQSLRFVFGHLAHGLERFFPQPVRYITVLRRPGPRILSLYAYIRRRSDHPLHDWLVGKNLSFGAYLEETLSRPKLKMQVDNRMVRQLAGEIDLEAVELGPAPLRQALANILSEDCRYGLTEHFDDFQARLKAEGLIDDVSPERVNAAPETADLETALDAMTPDQRAIYDGYVEADTAFYDICEQVYFDRHAVAVSAAAAAEHVPGADAPGTGR